MSSQHWVTEPTATVSRPVAKSGPASTPATTVMKKFEDTRDKMGDAPALIPASAANVSAPEVISWKSYFNMVISCAKSMIKVGLQPHDCVSILGFNSAEWLIANMGAIAAGGIAAGIYTTNGPEACQYIIEHSKSKVVFVENEMQFEKIRAIKDNLPEVRAVVQWSGKLASGVDYLYSWSQWMGHGKNIEESAVTDRYRQTQPGHCATLIYTSGTTGPPKAVMVSHDNMTWTASSVVEGCYNINSTDRFISYLPLSHIAAQMIDIHAPIATGAQLWFARPDALKGTLKTTLVKAQPTIFLGVPRVWEKIQEGMLAVGATLTGVKKSLSVWGKKTILAAERAKLGLGGSVPWGYFLAKKLVAGKAKAALGLSKTRVAASAAAPITAETVNYFMSLSIIIYEIYGMSESTGPQTVNYPGHHRHGTAGPTFPGAETRLDKAVNGEGEICFRGRHVFMGYMYNPEATASTIDEDGWLHSGDVGKLDKDGYLTITGRIKELIVTAGGENVPPVLIEEQIKSVFTSASQIVVIGDKRKFLTALVTLRVLPKSDAKEGEYPLTDKLTAAVVKEFEDAGVKGLKTVGDVRNSAEANKYIESRIALANKKATSNAQKVQKHTVLPVDFSVEAGTMTATQKLKRKIVNQQFESEIEAMYS